MEAAGLVREGNPDGQPCCMRRRTKGKVRLKKKDGKTFEARLVQGENGKINLEFK